MGSVLCLPSKYQKDDFDDDGGHAYILVILAVQKVLGKLVPRKEDIRCCLEIQFEYISDQEAFQIIKPVLLTASDSAPGSLPPTSTGRV